MTFTKETTMPTTIQLIKDALDRAAAAFVDHNGEDEQPRHLGIKKTFMGRDQMAWEAYYGDDAHSFCFTVWADNPDIDADKLALAVEVLNAWDDDWTLVPRDRENPVTTDLISKGDAVGDWPYVR